MILNYFLTGVALAALAIFLIFLLTRLASSTLYLLGFLIKVLCARVEILSFNLVPVTGSIIVLLLTFGEKVLLVWRLEWETLKPVDFFFPDSWQTFDMTLRINS